MPGPPSTGAGTASPSVTSRKARRATLVGTFAAFIMVAANSAARAEGLADLPNSFIDLHAVAPQIEIDIRYATDHNFVGHPLPGYDAATCMLTRPAGEALAGIESDLAAFGLGLKVYDCYRPQRAVDFFVRWAADPADQKMKKEFYPHVNKADLVHLGYIASPSGHSRGSTVDLTIVPLPYRSACYGPRQPLLACDQPASMRFADGSLDMGTGYDCFDPRASAHLTGLTGQERANRLLLATEMIQHGFQPYKYEWWHFTLKNEPYPSAYFDVPIR